MAAPLHRSHHAAGVVVTLEVEEYFYVPGKENKFGKYMNKLHCKHILVANCIELQHCVSQLLQLGDGRSHVWLRWCITLARVAMAASLAMRFFGATSSWSWCWASGWTCSGALSWRLSRNNFTCGTFHVVVFGKKGGVPESMIQQLQNSVNIFNSINLKKKNNHLSSTQLEFASSSWCDDL